MTSPQLRDKKLLLYEQAQGKFCLALAAQYAHDKRLEQNHFLLRSQYARISMILIAEILFILRPIFSSHARACLAASGSIRPNIHLARAQLRRPVPS